MNVLTNVKHAIDPILIMAYQLFIHEWVKPLYPDTTPTDEWMFGDTILSIKAGTLYEIGPEGKSLKFSIDLIQTDPFVLIMDTNSDEILAHFQLDQDVYGISISKQALVFKAGDKMGLFTVHSESMFHQLIVYLSPDICTYEHNPIEGGHKR